MSRAALLSSLVLCFWLPAAARANDGVDRHALHGPSLLQLFPDPVAPAAGYRVLAADAPGGADGDRAFRWAQPHAIALVRLAAHEAHRRLGGAVIPPAIFDLSAENGDTPVQIAARKPPRGRHPGGSHDGGLNLDLGYYLTSLVGKRFTPDHAACSDHFDPQGADLYQCAGPADRLDVARQALFMLMLVDLDARHFGGRLISAIGIDRRARDAVLAQIASWRRRRQHGASARLEEALRRVCTADRWEGWARAHHHHIHLRLADLELTGDLASGLQRLLAAQRRIDLRLHRGVGGTGPALRALLLSVGLSRAVELVLLGAEEICPRARFRVNGGAWVDADPADLTACRAVIDLPRRLHATEHALTAEVELPARRPPSPTRITAVLHAPRLEPHLAVQIDARQLEGFATRDRGTWTVGVRMPRSFCTLITAVSYTVHRGSDRKTLSAASPTDPSHTVVFRDPARAHPVDLIEATVTASGRKAFPLLLYARPAGS